MGDLSKNLSRSEFVCPCGKCTDDTIDSELITVLQDAVNRFSSLRDRVFSDVKIHINSGYRCVSHNIKIGGDVNSQHVKARAADFYLYYIDSTGVKIKIPPVAVFNYLVAAYPEKYGVGNYVGRTHVDTKSGYARRWDYS